MGYRDPPRPWTDAIDHRLVEWKAAGRWRTLSRHARSSRVHVEVAQVARVNFASNDYLGLSTHPACVECTSRCLGSEGRGATASRLVTGGSRPLVALEEALAAWTGAPRVLVFPTGYQANVGVLASLLHPEDLVFSDAHNHASIVDGCRLGRARVISYPHLEVDRLRERMAETRDLPGRRMIVTDGLFSMDGSLAPVRELAALAASYEALLVVDEAHSMGVLGPEGRGWCAHLGVTPDLLIGTFSKAFGGQGAFVAAAALLSDYLLQRARSLTYTTALPPATAAGNCAALAVIRSDEGEALRRRVIAGADRLRSRLADSGVNADGSGTPLISIHFTGVSRAGSLAEQLLRDGCLAWAFRPPTVPEGTSRLRLAVTAIHTEEQLDQLANSLVRALLHHPEVSQ